MPIHPQAVAFYRQGGAHKLAGRLDAAKRAFEAALGVAPGFAEARYSLGAILLSEGRLAEGFALIEARHEIEAFRNPRPSLSFPEWRGEPIDGRRLLIWPEQGFGDQIQSARFATRLAAQGAQVTLLCSPGLVRLFGGLGVDVIAASGPVSFPDPDYWVMCMSIAARLGIDRVEQLSGEPYLAGTMRSRPDGLQIGLVSRGDPRHPNDRMRSLSDDDAARLADLPGEIVDLDPAQTGARDFQDTADIIAGLDLVISVDTSVAHLAGAMGKPVWVLVPAFNTDWRWMQGRTDSPWYPSMRLFRQATPGLWAPVLDQVIRAVRRPLSQTPRAAG